jgi:hypothetical protein
MAVSLVEQKGDVFSIIGSKKWIYVYPFSTIFCHQAQQDPRIAFILQVTSPQPLKVNGKESMYYKVVLTSNGSECVAFVRYKVFEQVKTKIDQLMREGSFEGEITASFPKKVLVPMGATSLELRRKALDAFYAEVSGSSSLPEGVRIFVFDFFSHLAKSQAAKPPFSTAGASGFQSEGGGSGGNDGDDNAPGEFYLGDLWWRLIDRFPYEH